MILIQPRVMAGCREWWDRKVGPTLLLRENVDAAIANGQTVVWWLPDGRLLPKQPAPTSWEPGNGEPTLADLEYHYAMPERAITLEYGDNT